MKQIGEKITQRRNELKLSQVDVATALTQKGFKVTNQAIYKWEKNMHEPNARQFMALCTVLGIDNILETFLDNEEDFPLSKLNMEGQRLVNDYINLLIKSGMYERPQAKVISITRKIKLFDLPASAGPGQYLDDDSFSEIEVGNEVPEIADFGIRISGNSMEPQFINGQTVWVHEQPTLHNGEIGIFYYKGDAYCKKFLNNSNGSFLVSLNKDYIPITVDSNSDFKIFGKVVG